MQRDRPDFAARRAAEAAQREKVRVALADDRVRRTDRQARAAAGAPRGSAAGGGGAGGGAEGDEGEHDG